MFNCKIIFIVALNIVILTVINGDTNYKKPPASTNFDVLIFTQRWPPTVCYTWKESSVSHTCSLPTEKDEWTIHGIWPSQLHKLGPHFCDKSLRFNRTEVKSLEEQLKEKWIDIEYGRQSYSLWQHEWEKHGTCAVVLRQLSTQFKYFKEGLNLLEIYDMKHVLAKANIMPGKSYITMDILKGIEKILGKRAAVMCRNNKKTGDAYIFEIRICFDKTLELVDCDGIYEYPTNCDSYGKVIYPGEVPHLHHVMEV